MHVYTKDFLIKLSLNVDKNLFKTGTNYTCLKTKNSLVDSLSFNCNTKNKDTIVRLLLLSSKHQNYNVARKTPI